MRAAEAVPGSTCPVPIEPRCARSVAAGLTGHRCLCLLLAAILSSHPDRARETPRTDMTYRIGIDIGGTFTDFALLEPRTGRTTIHKRLTTPSDPARAVLEGTQKLLAQQKASMAEVETIMHGTTLITNATIERRGAVTGFLVTRGFRDVLDIGKEQRYDLFDLRIRFPDPLVPRPLRREVSERIQFDGTVETSLDDDEVRRAISELVEEHKIEALAVGLLHSYANSVHERHIQQLVRREFPSLHLSISSDICPFMREFERWTTTIVNAYTQPMVDRYLAALENGFKERGFGGKFYVMMSNGGVATPTTARQFPVRLIESGPAAGALMSSYLSQQLTGRPHVLSFDMGGTTAKGSLIRNQVPLRKDDLEVARVHAFKRGSGLPLKIPVIDMIEIGAGGGGIAAVDRRGVIRLGPHSAGADPGPACYGRNGRDATLTDANLVLGYLDPVFFLGGKITLHPDRAADAIQSTIASELDLPLARAAWGIHETANEEVARAFRVHAAERGFDYRGCSMIAFGGSGPIHAAQIARKLKIPEVIFPSGAGVMSAFGLLVSPLSHETIKSDRHLLDELDAGVFEAKFAAMTDEVTSFLRAGGIGATEAKIVRRLDMRYLGQGYEIEVSLPNDVASNELLQRLPALFAECYARVFAISFIEQPLEIINWKVHASGPLPWLSERGINLTPPATEAHRQALKARRQVYSPTKDGYAECLVYDRYALEVGARLTGPALIEENESTCVIGDGDRVTVDQYRNLVATVAEA
jgi:N-methylhydantoinase A